MSPRPSLLAVWMSMLALPACEHLEEGPPSGALCPEGSTLTWDNFGSAFMSSYCTRCHASTVTGAARQGAPSDHNLETVELVRMHSEHVDQLAAAGPEAVNTAMPTSAPTPSEDERRKLGEWLACGAP